MVLAFNLPPLHLHLDLPELPVLLRSIRAVGHQVLAAQLLLDLAVDTCQLRGPRDEEASPAGLLGQVVQLATHTGLQLAHIETDGVDSHAAAPGVLQRIAKGHGAGGIVPVGQQDHRSPSPTPRK